MYRDELLAGSIKIYIRRAGPNYQEGLKMMLKLRQESGLFIRVFGPEQDAVSVCPLALGLVPEDSLQDFDPDRREVKVDEKAKPPPVPDMPRSPQRTFSAGSLSSPSVWKSNFYGAFTLARRRGGAGSSPLDGAPDSLVDFHTGRCRSTP